MRKEVDWTPALVAQLTALWNQCPQLTARAIGDTLRMTRLQVIGKAFRLKLPARPSPIKARVDGMPMKAYSARRRRVVPPAGLEFPVEAAAVPAVVPEAPPGPVAEAIVAEAEGPVPWRPPPATLPVRRLVVCEWPMWGMHERPTHEYCCAPIEPGRRFCPEHCRLGFAKPQQATAA